MSSTAIITSPFLVHKNTFSSQNPSPNPISFSSRPIPARRRAPLPILSSSSSSSPNPNPRPKSKPRRRSEPKEPSPEPSSSVDGIPTIIPRKPRRGRPGEAAAVENFVRASLQRTFDSIRSQNADVLAGKEDVLKESPPEEKVEEGWGSDSVEDEKAVVVEEDDPDWPLDTEVGWGVRASEYFDKHPIKNVLGEDGVEIDWEGEVDEGWVKEINCLEWESFAFHPSPLVVLVFERYNRAADNWKQLMELEEAAKVYWRAKDRLPPRTIKIDMNIEKDLAYALKVRECPQLLFIRGNKIMYREKELRTSEELVQMIAHFYYNAKRPSWINPAAVMPAF